MARLPDGFLWGTATAAHQVEGGNWNNDWWAWEHTPGSGCAEPSGDACDSWNRWAEDVALCRQLGFGSYRFSIEWSRIEPEEGEWSRAALDHYRRIGEALLRIVQACTELCCIHADADCDHNARCCRDPASPHRRAGFQRLGLRRLASVTIERDDRRRLAHLRRSNEDAVAKRSRWIDLRDSVRQRA